MVEYTYDAWGKPLSKTGTMANTLGALNPFRYRGYVYDEETGLYYLRSRYYNPVWDRFLNADSVLGKPGQLLRHNVFGYCENAPSVKFDIDGHDSEWVNALYSEPELRNAQNALDFITIGIHYPIFTNEKYALKRIESVMPDIIWASERTGTPIPMIEAILFREIICYDLIDEIFGSLPTTSTGIAQIKASTAIRAESYLYHSTCTSGYMFKLLQSDRNNIFYCAVVLKYEASRLGYDITSLSRSQIQEVFAKYNGCKPRAPYAVETTSYYDAFKRFVTE